MNQRTHATLTHLISSHMPQRKRSVLKGSGRGRLRVPRPSTPVYKIQPVKGGCGRCNRGAGAAANSKAAQTGSIVGGISGEVLGTALGAVGGPAGAVAGETLGPLAGAWIGNKIGKAIYRSRRHHKKK
jgi:hypothetical protein